MYTLEIVLTIIVIILLCLACFSLYKFAKHFIDKHKSKQTLTGGYISDDIYSKYTELRYPNVITMSNRIKNNVDIINYYKLDKTDGLRCILFVTDVIKKFHMKKSVDIADTYTAINNNDELTILDTEYINNIYMIFDCPVYKNKDISMEPFNDRMNYVKNDANIMKNTIFKVKTYSDVDSWDDIIKYVNTTNKSTTLIDGIILQPKLDTYWDSKIYKVKTRTMNTIDFYLKHIGKGVYTLYLGGNPQFKFNSLRLGVRKSNVINSKLMLFESPYYATMVYDSNLKFEKQRGFEYFDTVIDEINKFNVKDLDGKIIEMTYNGVQFYPIRVRVDKQYPNSYMVGVSNIDVIFDPLNTNNTYFNNVNNFTPKFDERIRNAFHSVNQKIRKYMFDTYVNTGKNVLDLAGGRGGDYIYLYDKGYRNFFCEDADSTALVTYMSKLQRMNMSIKNNDKINANTLHYMLGVDNSVVVADMKRRYEYPNSGFDTIIMNYAIHYLCDDTQKILALNKLIHDVISYKGQFVFTYFDGDRILNDMKGANILKLGVFELKYNNGILTMPLPTIDRTGYRDEPIVTHKILENIDVCKYMEYNLVDECKTDLNVEGYADIIEYLRYIKVRIYCKYL